jgi:hypothetical protein
VPAAHGIDAIHAQDGQQSLAGAVADADGALVTGSSDYIPPPVMAADRQRLTGAALVDVDTRERIDPAYAHWGDDRSRHVNY